MSNTEVKQEMTNDFGEEQQSGELIYPPYLFLQLMSNAPEPKVEACLQLAKKWKHEDPDPKDVPKYVAGISAGLYGTKSQALTDALMSMLVALSKTKQFHRMNSSQCVKIIRAIEIVPHQDSRYLYDDVITVVAALWFAFPKQVEEYAKNRGSMLFDFVLDRIVDTFDDKKPILDVVDNLASLILATHGNYPKTSYEYVLQCEGRMHRKYYSRLHGMFAEYGNDGSEDEDDDEDDDEVVNEDEGEGEEAESNEVGHDEAVEVEAES
ncbi:hypothetical protein DIURU_001449 [Diutina rugosa]|uniref:Uncharacterized protein n=1 Tax=Diutina rugosa TaxID=5481 RepID=A0A642UZ81_DIURU|nr:uncharacterized protein DIURU_001449 [Diutina rugosa]KAA8905646.1 hypothetical protein DIURU_001449 [Diutina rugosa]